MEMAKKYEVRYKYELLPIKKRERFFKFITTFVDEKVQLFQNEHGEFTHLKYRDMDGNTVDFDSSSEEKDM